MSPLPVTVLIAAKNEALNLQRCLASFAWAERVVVIDSQSHDETAEIAARMGAEVVQFYYPGGYPKKRQWALDHVSVDTPWILFADADESIPPQLSAEIAGIVNSLDARDAYFIRKGFHFLGRKFRFGGFSHSAILLFKTGKVRFEHLIDDPAEGLDMEVHERLIVDGKIGSLQTPLIHQDEKGLEAYIDRHNKYSTWEARVRLQLLDGQAAATHSIRASAFGNLQERRRFLKGIAIRTPGEPILWFLYHYIFRLGVLEGGPGFIASRLRAQYISQARAKVYELKLLRQGAIRRDKCGDRKNCEQEKVISA
jgi:glycosyltransferase involved in cell wall biosynthesis